jgi:hypothetical protein
MALLHRQDDEMKKRRTYSRVNLISLIVVAGLLLAACSPGGVAVRGGDGTIIWLDQPMTNYMLPVAPFNLIAHASHTGGGISQVTFLVNGVAVGTTTTDPSLEFLRADTSWNPSGPGLYMIQAQATSPGGLTETRFSNVCIEAGITAPQPWVGTCGTTTGNPFTIHFDITPNPVFRGDCIGNSLLFNAVLSGDTSRVTGLHANWNYTNLDGSAPPTIISGEELVMVRQSDTVYSYTRDFLNATRDFGLPAGTYLINASVWAVDSSGNKLETQNVGPIQWQECSAGPTTTGAPPTETPGIATTTPHIPTITPYIPTITPIPADTTPPSITSIVVTPSDNAYYITGCGPNVVTVQANVADLSGISSVILNYRYSGGAQHQIAMNNTGGNTYSGTINVGAEGYAALSGLSGTLTISIQATDQYSNSGSVNWGGSVFLQYCPG